MSHSNESSLPVLSHDAICLSKFQKMKFGNLVEICLWPHLAVKGLELNKIESDSENIAPRSCENIPRRLYGGGQVCAPTVCKISRLWESIFMRCSRPTDRSSHLYSPSCLQLYSEGLECPRPRQEAISSLISTNHFEFRLWQFYSRRSFQ